jgi:hypothetical protein
MGHRRKGDRREGGLSFRFVRSLPGKIDDTQSTGPEYQPQPANALDLTIPQALLLRADEVDSAIEHSGQFAAVALLAATAR